MNTRNLRRHLKQVLFVLIAASLALGVTAFTAGFSKGRDQIPGTSLEGYHDGNDGVVNAKQCIAFGWIADLTDPDADLEVRILADGAEVATQTAGLEREDVEACTDGTCGYEVKLWGEISPGIKHTITVQANVPGTTTWVDLWGTGKEITCWGYPAGVHDGAEGIVGQEDCTAFGWVVDPDNLDRDLQVHILADDVEVTTVVADDFGQDMKDSGICPGGTCRFTVNLWDLISHDKRHPIRAQVVDDESGETRQLGGTPKTLTCTEQLPLLRAFPDRDFIDGWFWPANEPVQVTTDGHDFTATANDDGLAEFDLDGYDLMRGETLTMTNGEFTAVHTVKQLFITDFDQDAQTVAGTVDGEGTVHVWSDDGEIYTLSDVDGRWLADFSALEDPVLYPGACIGAEAWGEGGSSTIVNRCTPFTHFSVFPEQGVVEGWEWPIGDTVQLTIDDPITPTSPVYETEGVVEAAPWDGVTPWLWIDFSKEYHVNAGDLVKLAGDSGSTMHTVRALDVTGMDPTENVVSGTSAPNAEIRLWPWDSGETLIVNADGEGNWSGDLYEIRFDIDPGDTVRASIVDDRGNETAVDRSALRTIGVDVRPLTDQNLVACRFPSVLIPVALLSEADFDASKVDPDSIYFGRTGSEAGVVRIGQDDQPMKYRLDVNGDGYRDIVYYFRLGETGFSCADIPAGRYSVRLDATLTGWAGDYGYGVEGVDFLRLFRILN